MHKNKQTILGITSGLFAGIIMWLFVFIIREFPTIQGTATALQSSFFKSSLLILKDTSIIFSGHAWVLEILFSVTFGLFIGFLITKNQTNNTTLGASATAGLAASGCSACGAGILGAAATGSTGVFAGILGSAIPIIQPLLFIIGIIAMLRGILKLTKTNNNICSIKE